MEFKNAYTHGFGLPFEKVTKDGREYIRRINETELIEYSHEKVDELCKRDDLVSLAGYISRMSKKFPNIIIDLSGNIALSELTREEFRLHEISIMEDFKDDYEVYQQKIKDFRADSLHYILTPKREDFHRNESLIITPEVKDFIFTMGWHIHADFTTENIAEILLNWKHIHKSLTQFK